MRWRFFSDLVAPSDAPSHCVLGNETSSFVQLSIELESGSFRTRLSCSVLGRETSSITEVSTGVEFDSVRAGLSYRTAQKDSSAPSETPENSMAKKLRAF